MRERSAREVTEQRDIAREINDEIQFEKLTTRYRVAKMNHSSHSSRHLDVKEVSEGYGQYGDYGVLCNTVRTLKGHSIVTPQLEFC